MPLPHLFPFMVFGAGSTQRPTHQLAQITGVTSKRVAVAELERGVDFLRLAEGLRDRISLEQDLHGCFSIFTVRLMACTGSSKPIFSI